MSTDKPTETAATAKVMSRSERLHQLVLAHQRMIGRCDASDIESRRATRTGRFEDSFRHARAANRRLMAAMRISAAMRAVAQS